MFNIFKKNGKDVDRKNFKESDLAQIAEALGCDLKIEFVPKEVR